MQSREVSDYSLFPAKYITWISVSRGGKHANSKDNSLPSLVCVFKDCREVNIVQDSSFPHLTKAQDKQTCFLLSLTKETQPPCCLCIRPKRWRPHNEQAPSPASGVSSVQSHASARAFWKASQKRSKEMLTPEQSPSKQIKAWENKDSVPPGTSFV